LLLTLLFLMFLQPLAFLGPQLLSLLLLGCLLLLLFLSAVDVPGAPAVAKISAFAVATTAVDVHPATVVSNVSSVPALDGVLTVEHPLVSTVLASLLLASPDVPVVS
jgi:hypothetical protein